MKYALVAQLDRVFGYEPKGQGFESLQACQKKTSFAMSFLLFSKKTLAFWKNV